MKHAFYVMCQSFGKKISSSTWASRTVGTELERGTSHWTFGADLAHRTWTKCGTTNTPSQQCNTLREGLDGHRAHRNTWDARNTDGVRTLLSGAHTELYSRATRAVAVGRSSDVGCNAAAPTLTTKQTKEGRRTRREEQGNKPRTRRKWRQKETENRKGRWKRQ
jgi:hypothetical protein